MSVCGHQAAGTREILPIFDANLSGLPKNWAVGGRNSLWRTYTLENYFSILKCGFTGNYQWVSGKHSKRYLGEFNFRYITRKTTDSKRAAVAAKGIQGKRMTIGGLIAGKVPQRKYTAEDFRKTLHAIRFKHSENDSD